MGWLLEGIEIHEKNRKKKVLHRDDVRKFDDGKFPDQHRST